MILPALSLGDRMCACEALSTLYVLHRTHVLQRCFGGCIATSDKRRLHVKRVLEKVSTVQEATDRSQKSQ